MMRVRNIFIAIRLAFLEGRIMPHRVWRLLIIALMSIANVQALEIGEKVPDFVMPSANGAPQRLSEQIGSPMMLIWLEDCNACSEDLVEWQYLADSWEIEGLKTWVIWPKEKGSKAPWSRLPVLVYEDSNAVAWWFEDSPAVMLVDSDGRLEYVFYDNFFSNRADVKAHLNKWLK